MALLKGGGMNEGSLLRRTLIHIGAFAVGSLAFVAVITFVLVSVAKSLLPSHESKSAESARKDATEEEEVTPVKATPKLPKSKRARDVIVQQEETPNSPSEK